MINVMLTNAKLFHRATGIVTAVAEADEDTGAEMSCDVLPPPASFPSPRRLYTRF